MDGRSSDLGAVEVGDGDENKTSTPKIVSRVKRHRPYQDPNVSPRRLPYQNFNVSPRRARKKSGQSPGQSSLDARMSPRRLRCHTSNKLLIGNVCIRCGLLASGIRLYSSDQSSQLCFSTVFLSRAVASGLWREMEC